MPVLADEPVYSIGAVAKMLDVPTSTLRGWEKRYSLVAPGRSKGSHRLYSSNQVEQLRFIKTRLEAGASVADAHRLLAQKASRRPGAPLAAGAPEEPKDGAVMVGGVQVPIHAHYPTFYASDEGRLRMAIPFLREGLRLGQPCFLSASGEVREAYLHALAGIDDVDIEQAINSRQLVLVSSLGATVEECVALWERTFWAALEEGPSVIRVVGDMECERSVFSSDDEMMRYESAYNGIARRFPTVTLCQYDVRTFDGVLVFQALKAHPDVYDLKVGTLLS
jgi:transcriptional repressor of dcmA and dcmR